MFSIGELSKLTDVKITTIRYYESIGLLEPVGRTEGNQRRYNKVGLDRLHFIKHARDLGFTIESISSLIELQDHPDQSCYEATKIAKSQLHNVRVKIKQLQSLENELSRISEGCSGNNTSENCYVLTSLSNHSLCGKEH